MSYKMLYCVWSNVFCLSYFWFWRKSNVDSYDQVIILAPVTKPLECNKHNIDFGCNFTCWTLSLSLIAIWHCSFCWWSKTNIDISSAKASWILWSIVRSLGSGSKSFAHCHGKLHFFLLPKPIIRWKWTKKTSDLKKYNTERKLKEYLQNLKKNVEKYFFRMSTKSLLNSKGLVTGAKILTWSCKSTSNFLQSRK